MIKPVIESGQEVIELIQGKAQEFLMRTGRIPVKIYLGSHYWSSLRDILIDKGEWLEGKSYFYFCGMEVNKIDGEENSLMIDFGVNWISKD